MTSVFSKLAENSQARALGYYVLTHPSLYTRAVIALRLFSYETRA